MELITGSERSLIKKGVDKMNFFAKYKKAIIMIIALILAAMMVLPMLLSLFN